MNDNPQESSNPRTAPASVSVSIDMSALDEHPPHNLHQRHLGPNVEASNDSLESGSGPPAAQESVENGTRRNSEANHFEDDTFDLPQRLSGILGQNPELQAVMDGLEKYIPFSIILSIKLLLDHGSGIAVFICLLITSIHANSVVKAQVGRQERRGILPLVAVSVNLVACGIFIYFVFQDEKLLHCLIFWPPSSVESFYELVWIVGINDFILKFVAVVLKIVLILTPANLVPFHKRGKYFLFIERANQFHRELAPIQVWLVYLLNGYQQIPGKVIGVILVAAYMVAKGRLLIKSARGLKLAIQKLMQSTNYGNQASGSQVKGSNCPICYDSFRLPVILHCKHIFCEECLSAWFDRERTCPLCRAQITEDPEWRDGATSQFVQLF